MNIAKKANSPDRDWEAFDDINFGQKMKDDGCKDIAAQLIEENSFINVNFKFKLLKKFQI